jgi:TnpA family transposase
MFVDLQRRYLAGDDYDERSQCDIILIVAGHCEAATTGPRRDPATARCLAGYINVALIRAHWSEILRVVASIRTGTVTASLIMRQLTAYPRQNGVAAAPRELGRLERTLFTLAWISEPQLRRETGQELNKGEARNSLARAVFIHRLGEIRGRTYEDQQHRASGLNLLVTAIILWNTRYLQRAVALLRQAEDVPRVACSPVAARLGACEPHRRLRLGHPERRVQKPRRVGATANLL